MKEQVERRLARSGEEAVARATSDPPDLILLDLSMPGLGGAETCRQLRSHPATASVPVLMLSGDDPSYGFEEGRTAGATDFLAKPFEKRVVLDRVRSAIETASA